MNLRNHFTEHFAKLTTPANSETYFTSDCWFTCHFPPWDRWWGSLIQQLFIKSLLCTKHCAWSWNTRNKVRSCLPGASGLFGRKTINEYTMRSLCLSEDKLRKHVISTWETRRCYMCVGDCGVSFGNAGSICTCRRYKERELWSWEIFKIWNMGNSCMTQCAWE